MYWRKFMKFKKVLLSILSLLIIIALIVPLFAGDAQYILLRSTTNSSFDTLLWMLKNKRQWQYYEFDLINYRGQTRNLQFGTYNDGSGGVTAMFVDDVELLICK